MSLHKETIGHLLLNSVGECRAMLSDCTTCSESSPEDSAICLRCNTVFGASCLRCVVSGTAVKLERHRFPYIGVYEYVRKKVRCKKCEAELQPTRDLEQQKHVVEIDSRVANKMSSENIIARALLPLQLTNLVLSGNLAMLQSSTILREDFTGTDLELIRATFADGDWEITITFGYVKVPGKRLHPFAIEFGFGTVWRFDGERCTTENEDEQMLCAFFRTPADPWFVRNRSQRMREMFKLLGWRLVEAVEAAKEPTPGLHLLWQIRNYMVYCNH